MPVEFKAWPKTPRLFRPVTITEKIDGTNAAVIIHDRFNLDNGVGLMHIDDIKAKGFCMVNVGHDVFIVGAQSRKRLITPDSDNYGFATWVYENAEYLAETLGEGYHYGEWWGQGIQRRYGLDHKRFSLFNVRRWQGTTFEHPQLRLVPVLYQGDFNDWCVEQQIDRLVRHGSEAAPEFPNPEGICVFHEDANQVFKVLIENDHLPKSAVA